MSSRVSRVRDRLLDLDADALLISSLPNIRWSCGFTGSNGLLLVGPESAHFVTDGRYTEQARAEVVGANVHIAEEGLSTFIAEESLLAPYSRIAFQADVVSVAKRDDLAETHDSVTWVPVTDALTKDIASKDSTEIDRIRAAQRITESVFEQILTAIEPGMTEREVAAEIVYRHLRRGADAMSFDPIVASGPNAARPHARPTDRTLRKGEMIVLDMGCFREGYASDMTRTVALGDPGKEARRGYEAVRKAQDAALTAARSGMTGQELDAVARDVLVEAGLDEYFSHGLGHGIGLQVHEWPRVSRTSDATLPEGACVTIEPGVYVPGEAYGVRIEDIIILRKDGSSTLTRALKTLKIL